MNANKDPRVLQKIFKENQMNYKKSEALSGGDINEVYLVEGSSGRFVVKLNSAQRYPWMFEAEKTGLEKLAATGVIDVPKPVVTGKTQDFAYLILEYKNQGNRAANFWQKFGEQMASLHQTTSEYFGLEKDNYIGSLPQYNNSRKTAAEFYIEMRLHPQIKMAEERGFQLDVSESFYRHCEEIIPLEKPALIHGDLWNGNYLVNAEGLPCLIDPAVAFGSREMDLGMMKLFGGFDDKLFHTYNEIFPLESGWEKRIPLWQLYYLLVHLNIFGAGYKSQVISILRKYS